MFENFAASRHLPDAAGLAAGAPFRPLAHSAVPRGPWNETRCKIALNGEGARPTLTVFPEVPPRLSVFLRTLLLAICVHDAVHDGFRVAAGHYPRDHRRLRH